MVIGFCASGSLTVDSLFDFAKVIWPAYTVVSRAAVGVKLAGTRSVRAPSAPSVSTRFPPSSTHLRTAANHLSLSASL
jgi:hypothetical protein